MSKSRFFIATITLLLEASAALGDTALPQLDETQLDHKKRQEIVERIAEAMQENYVFPDVGQTMAAHLHQQLKEGAYNELDTLNPLSQQLTEDLRAISKDLHLRIRPMPARELSAEQNIDEEEQQRRRLDQMRARNFGFAKLELLEGNVGYFELRGFMPAEYGGPTAKAALNFLSNADALIIDLRRNGGGSPSMIQLISSYFFNEPVHLNSFYIRRGDQTQQFWTQADVEGPRMVDKPIYILTSGRTFSAAEEFTYNLKNLERAKVFGETTGGGAHPVNRHRFPELGLEAWIPFGRAINPITGTNWEGTGVKPHVPLPAAEALTAAHRAALEQLLEAADADRSAALSWALEGIEAKLNPVDLEPEQLAAYVGQYGRRTVSLDNGQLKYQQGTRSAVPLIPMGDHQFALEGTERQRIRFETEASGKVVKLVDRYDDGMEMKNPRKND